MSTPRERLTAAVCRMHRSRWATPAWAVLFGVVALIIQAFNDDLGWGVVSLALMLLFAGALVVLGGRVELAALLRGGPSDERADLITTRALAATGGVLVLVLVAGSFVEMARGSGQVGVWSGSGRPVAG